MTTIEAVPATSQPTPPQPIPQPTPQPFAVASREPAQLAPAPAKAPRLTSLDVFRGITIASMVLVNVQPDPKYWPLEHVEWHGWTPTDLIFPFFLFIVGVATPFSLGKRAAGGSRAGSLAHIWARAISLFALGELLTGLPYTAFTPAPAGYEWIKTLRITLAALSVLGVLLLLIPWRSKTLQLWLPPIILVLFYVAAVVCNQVIKRTSGLPADFSFGNGLLNPLHLRIPGVLQRIGICYGVAASIGLFFGWRMVLLWAIALMSIYSGLMLNVPFTRSSHVEIPFAPPNTAVKAVGELTKYDNLSRRADEWLLIRDGRWNHAYGNYPDNEGGLSTLPSIAEVLLGILAGVWLRTFRPAAERGMGLLVFGLFALLAGMALDRWLMPINKNIWTPSFTVFTSGLALLCLGTVFYFVDVLGYRAWSLPFKIYGMNAIAAFVVYGLIFKLLMAIKLKKETGAPNAWGWYEHHIYSGMDQLSTALGHISPRLAAINAGENRSLAFALSYVVVICLLMSILYVCKIFVKV